MTNSRVQAYLELQRLRATPVGNDNGTARTPAALAGAAAARKRQQTRAILVEVGSDRPKWLVELKWLLRSWVRHFPAHFPPFQPY